ncbi:MAG: chalcone isomerase family protein [Candidatus Krumholzibacteriota bacterium]
MYRYARFASLLALIILMMPWSAGAIIEPDTEMEYDDTVTIETDGASYTLTVTGVGLREKTFLKVNVYAIVSYVATGTQLKGDLGISLLELDAPKMIRMDLVRGFSREKLCNAFKDVIEDNYEDLSAFSTDMDAFLAYFENDAQEGDELVFTYIPGKGLKTVLNGAEQGVITNFEFVKALWTVWFGAKPASDGLKEDLLVKVAG